MAVAKKKRTGNVRYREKVVAVVNKMALSYCLTYACCYVSHSTRENVVERAKKKIKYLLPKSFLGHKDSRVLVRHALSTGHCSYPNGPTLFSR